VFSTGIILHEMLTTEKLFRGDTELALMEKVRKAEVPPPSNFNRRVTPELDQIVLKALARDVADRYQSAAALAQNLDALIAGYRFDPKELRQFMRQLFRKEYSKEIEETTMALDPRTGAEPRPRTETPAEITSQTRPTSEPSERPAGADPAEPAGGKPAAAAPPPTPTPTEPAPPPVTEDSGEKPRGFWGSLFKRKR